MIVAPRSPATLAVLALLAAPAAADARILSMARGLDSNVLIHGDAVWFVQAGGGTTVLDVETGAVLARDPDGPRHCTLRCHERGVACVTHPTVTWYDRRKVAARAGEAPGRITAEKPGWAAGEHLERARADRALPDVVERAIERPWFARDPGRAHRLNFLRDEHLDWTERRAVVGSPGSEGFVEGIDLATGETAWVYRFVPRGENPGPYYAGYVSGIERDRTELLRPPSFTGRLVLEPGYAAFRAKVRRCEVGGWALGGLLAATAGWVQWRTARRAVPRWELAVLADLALAVACATGLHAWGRVSGDLTKLLALELVGLAGLAVLAVARGTSPGRRLETAVVFAVILLILAAVGEYPVVDLLSGRSAVF